MSAKSIGRFWLCACFTMIMGLAPPAIAESVTGCVVGKDGAPKAYVTVEILASGKMRVNETDEKGCFSINLKSGKYLIRVREGRRRQDFAVKVRGGGVNKTFKVKW